MAVVYLVVRLHSLMDRTAVSGTAGTGSIPVGGASRKQTTPRYVLGAERLRKSARGWFVSPQNLQRRGLLTPQIYRDARALLAHGRTTGAGGM